jgi:hypothetical protein
VPRLCISPRRAAGLATSLGVSLVASIAVCAHGAEPRRLMRHTVSPAFQVTWTTRAPGAFAAFAGPEDEAPGTSPPRVNEASIPAYGAIAQMCHLRRIAVTRIGGLYGP